MGGSPLSGGGSTGNVRILFDGGGRRSPGDTILVSLLATIKPTQILQREPLQNTLGRLYFRYVLLHHELDAIAKEAFRSL